MRIQPKPWIGVVVLLAYLAVFYGVWIATGIDYNHIGDSESTLLKWYVAPLASGALVLIIAASALGWWRPALFEKQRAPRWGLVAPGLTLVTALGVLLLKDHSGSTASMWVYVALGSLLVGFAEEMATRGILIVGLRGRFVETKVWLFSTLLFMSLHVPNLFFGVGTLIAVQLPLTFLSGTVYYLARRSSGSLVFAMLVHAAWDFSSFAGEDSGGSSGIALVMKVLIGVLALVLVVRILRGTKGQMLEQYS